MGQCEVVGGLIWVGLVVVLTGVCLWIRGGTDPVPMKQRRKLYAAELARREQQALREIEDVGQEAEQQLARLVDRRPPADEYPGWPHGVEQ